IVVIPAIRYAYHKTLFPHPAILSFRNNDSQTDYCRRTNSMKPKKRARLILPLRKLFSLQKPLAGSTLVPLAGGVMVQGWIRCCQPLINPRNTCFIKRKETSIRPVLEM